MARKQKVIGVSPRYYDNLMKGYREFQGKYCNISFYKYTEMLARKNATKKR